MRVGVDLGTTFSLISRMGTDGAPVLMPDQMDQDAFHTPSVVYLSGSCAFVGQVVENLLEQDPGLKTIRFFKRHLGQRDPIHYDDQGTPWHAEAVGALVLKKLRFDAESYSATTLESAVITVPAHFNDPQRKAVLAAAALAEIPVLGLVEEPVAAALHYGVARECHDQVLLVYDFGGGTFDVTVLSLNASSVNVLSKGGVTDLGGKELDEAIGEMVLAQFHRALGSPPSLNVRTLQELRRASEALKIDLGMPGKTKVRKLVLLGNQAVEVNLDRRDFEAAIGGLLERAEAVTLKCIEDAGLRPADVDCILLVGGSSLVPAVSDRMRKRFTRPGQRVLFHEPSKAVAFGAALHASQLAGEADLYQIPPEFKGVTGYAVGVRTLSLDTGRVAIDTIIRKNMPLPVRVKKTYFTTRPNQDRIVLELVQFREGPADAVSLGQLVVGPLPAPRQNYPIEVTVENREDGTVSVQAYDSQTGVELNQVFGRDADGGLSHLASQRALVRSTFINNG